MTETSYLFAPIAVNGNCNDLMDSSTMPMTQEPLRLWLGRAPLVNDDGPATAPRLTPYFPDPNRRTGSAIIVCPGGGYQTHAPHEKEPIALWLNSLGIAAFVLEYRVAP